MIAPEADDDDSFFLCVGQKLVAEESVFGFGL